MSTRESESHGLGGAARRIVERARSVVRHELELARLELQRKVAALGLGIGLALAGAVFLLFAIGFGLAAFAAGLATTLSTWLSLLIVAGSTLAAAAALVALAVAAFKRSSPPVPELALEEAKRTAAELERNGR